MADRVASPATHSADAPLTPAPSLPLTIPRDSKDLVQDPDFCLPECLRPMVSDDPLVSLPGGSKRSLRYLRQKLEDYNVNWDALWQKIRRVVLAALFSAQAKIPFQPNSFELFGFDVMVDESLKVWLLEVNASPSLGIQTPLDQRIKKELICDVLKLVDPTRYDRDSLLEVVQKKVSDLQNPKSASRGRSQEEDDLNADLRAVLVGRRPRQYGEMPSHVGNFERLSPSTDYNLFSWLKLGSRK